MILKMEFLKPVNFIFEFIELYKVEVLNTLFLP